MEKEINDYIDKTIRKLAIINKDEASDDFDFRELLMGGNCGTFALAMFKRFHSAQPELCIISNAEEEGDIFSKDTTIYHVCLYIDGMYVDGDGVNLHPEDMLHWINKEYGNPDDMSLFSFDVDEVDDKYKYFYDGIRKHTDWFITTETFL